METELGFDPSEKIEFNDSEGERSLESLRTELKKIHDELAQLLNKAANEYGHTDKIIALQEQARALQNGINTLEQKVR